jgi:DNA-binding transcriptional LysR family regulator
MLDPVKLATLRAVLAHGSFSAAARATSLTQPAVSRQVGLLERHLGTPLVVRAPGGVRATEAGRVLDAHAEAILARIALAERQVGALAGLRAGHVRLGSFLSALGLLSTRLGAELEAAHPELFSGQEHVIEDELVDRATAFARLAAGELDLALVFEHLFEPSPPPEGIEVVELFADPPRLLLPAGHRLARRRRLTLDDVAGETWIRAHHGSAARLVDHVLEAAGLEPPLLRAGHGDEPIEAQTLIAAGQGVTLAHAMTLIVDVKRIAVVELRDARAPHRVVQAALAHGHRAPATLAALDVLTGMRPPARG